MPNQAANDLTRCPVCGQSNQCSLANPTTATQPCWCFSVTISAQTLSQQSAVENNKACLCQHCAQAQLLANADAP